MSEHRPEHEQRVTPLELFFDLVFVFAFTQVTTLLSHNQTWSGLGHGVLILAALWWTWAGYAWLTNTVNPEEGAVAAALLVALAAMFIAALAVPTAFGEHGVVFGVAFLIVTFMHLTLYALAGRGSPDLVMAVLRLSPAALAGAALILVAGFARPELKTPIWLAALIVAYVGTQLGGLRGWRVHPAHFVERHGLIVIIALGESFVAIGLGAAGDIDLGVIVASVLGLLVATGLWLAYFDFFTIRGEELLVARSGVQRTRFARDLYTYLHLPMIVGIVLFAFGMKTTLAHVGDELGSVAAFCLCGGCALYLSAYVVLRYRVARTLGRGRFSATIVFVLLIPLATAVPALVALALVAAVWVALHLYELIWWREARAEARAVRVAAPAS